MAIGKLPGGEGDEADVAEGIFAEINITPLTDVFLVLVIIFMVGALAVKVESRQEKKKTEAMVEQTEAEKRSGLKINLPSGAAQDIDPKDASLVLTIAVNGDVEAAGQPITDAELDNLFRAAFARDKSTQVIIKADRGTQHGRVVGVMERAKRAGLTRLAFGTQ